MVQYPGESEQQLLDPSLKKGYPGTAGTGESIEHRHMPGKEVMDGGGNAGELITFFGQRAPPRKHY